MASEGKETKNDVDSDVDGGQHERGASNVPSSGCNHPEEESKRRRDVKADSKKQRSFQANLFGNLFFKHLQKAKSSLDHDKD